MVDIGLVAKEMARTHPTFGRTVMKAKLHIIQRIYLPRGRAWKYLNELKSRRQIRRITSLKLVSGLSQQVMKDVETSIGLSNLKPVTDTAPARRSALESKPGTRRRWRSGRQTGTGAASSGSTPPSGGGRETRTAKMPNVWNASISWLTFIVPSCAAKDRRCGRR